MLCSSQLLEHSVPDVEDFSMTTEIVEGFLDFSIFVYSEGESQQIALSDIFEFFLVSQVRVRTSEERKTSITALEL